MGKAVTGWVAAAGAVLVVLVVGVVVEAEVVAAFLVCLVAAERRAAFLVVVKAGWAGWPPLAPLSLAPPAPLELLLLHWRYLLRSLSQPAPGLSPAMLVSPAPRCWWRPPAAPPPR